MNLLETAKQGLEALDWCIAEINRDSPASLNARTVIKPLRQAIEQAEKQKPVAWSVLDKRTGRHWYTHESKYTAQYYANEYSHRESDNTPSMVVTPLYTAPPQREWVGLTDEDLNEIDYPELRYIGTGEYVVDGDSVYEFAKAIEAKLRGKNT